MKITWPRLVKEMVFFWLIFVIFTAGVLFFLAHKRQTSFNGEVYEHLLTGESRFKEKTDNPCKYSVIGDPDTTNYIKLNLSCKAGESHNTLALAAFKDQTVAGILSEFGRMNGFTFSVTQHWSCILNLLPVKDFNLAVGSGSDLSCQYE